MHAEHGGRTGGLPSRALPLGVPSQAASRCGCAVVIIVRVTSLGFRAWGGSRIRVQGSKISWVVGKGLAGFLFTERVRDNRSAPRS